MLAAGHRSKVGCRAEVGVGIHLQKRIQLILLSGRDSGAVTYNQRSGKAGILVLLWLLPQLGRMRFRRRFTFKGHDVDL